MASVGDLLQHRVVRRIRELASQRKVALTHLPDRAGISRSHFWDVMAGRKSPTLTWMAKVAAALAIDPSELVSSSSEDLPREIVTVQRTGLRLVEGRPEQRYETCLPLVSLRAAASAFGDPQHVSDDDFEWVELAQRLPLRRGMFVAQVVGTSMEPKVPDGAYCVFLAPVARPRGKIVLVQMRDGIDPDTGHRYTVKRYDTERRRRDGTLTMVTLQPTNAAFAPLVLSNADGVELAVIAELVDVVRAE